MLSQVNGDIYGKAAFYFVMIDILALCMMPSVILHNKKTTKGNRHFFRKSALAFQFCIGMLFIFCMIVLMKQISLLVLKEKALPLSVVGTFLKANLHK